MIIQPTGGVWVVPGESETAQDERHGRNLRWPSGNEEVCTRWVISSWLPAGHALLDAIELGEIEQLIPENPLWARIHRLFLRILRSTSMSQDLSTVIGDLTEFRLALDGDRYEIGQYFHWLADRLLPQKDDEGHLSPHEHATEAAVEKIEIVRSTENARSIEIRRVRGEHIVDSVVVRGPALVEFVVLVERLSRSRPQRDLVPWKEVCASLVEQRHGKGLVPSEKSLADYGRRVRGQLEEMNLAGFWKQTPDGGVRFPWP